MNLQAVSVFQIGGKLFLETESPRIFGLYATGPVFSCGLDDHTLIGTIALQALDCSVPDLDPKLRPEKGRVLPILQASGLRSWSALMGRAKHVNVRRKDGTITVLSSENMGPRGGFGGKSVSFPSSADPAELGAVIMKAMALSTRDQASRRPGYTSM